MASNSIELAKLVDATAHIIEARVKLYTQLAGHENIRNIDRSITRLIERIEKDAGG